MDFDWNLVLDMAMENLQVVTDYALAKAIDVSHAAVAQYRSHARAPDPDICCRLAEVNHENPLLYIAIAEAWRAKSQASRRRWLKRLASYGTRKGRDRSRP